MGTLSSECEEALRTCVARACEQVIGCFENPGTTSLGVLDSAWSAILDVVHQELIRNARKYNATHSPALRLPPELLYAILKPLRFRERLRAGRVCQFWKNVAYAFPLPVYVPRNEREVAVLTDRLRHFTPAPLQLSRIEIWGINDCDVALCGFLREHMWRIQHLDFWFQGSGLTHEDLQTALTAALRMPAPQLRRLRFHGRTAALLEVLDDSWFDGHAPQLTACRVPWRFVTAPAFRVARTVELYAFPGHHPYATLRTVLETLPHLENLHVAEAQWAHPAQRLHIPPTLQRLWMRGPARLLDCVDHTQISHIHIIYPHGEPGTDAALADDMRRLALPPATHIDMHLSTAHGGLFRPPVRGTLLMRTYDAARRYCRVYELPEPAQSVQAPPGFFAHVTSLPLAGLAAGALGTAPYLPTVQRLAVSCASQHDHFCRPPGARLRCPALTHLVLHGPRVPVLMLHEHEPVPALRAGDAAQFVHGLDLGRALESLRVCGAQLVEPGIDAMRALVVRIEVDADAAPLEAWIDAVAFESMWGPRQYELLRA